MTFQFKHESILLEQCIEAMQIRSNGIYIDATFGRGGHTQRMLDVSGKDCQILAIDRDVSAIEHGEKHITDPRLTLIHANYSEIGAIAKQHDIYGEVAAILVDCGVSSPQLDEAERGFSFSHDAPLDMRMNQMQELTAEKWINNASEQEIADVIYQNADERYSRKIAKAICNYRQERAITRTKELADIVKSVVRQVGPSHPATRTFQAIRVHINDEYRSLEKMLDESINVLKIGGRLVMISFHSTEHKIIKRCIQLNRPGNENLKRGLQTPNVPRVKRIGRAIKPSLQEVRRNARSRSAQLRIVEKIA